MIRIAVAAFLLVGASPALAQTGSARYRFTTVLDSARDGLTPTRCAAINTSGTIAVVVEDIASSIEMLVTKRGATDAPVVLADTRRVANFPTPLRQRIHRHHVGPLDQRAGRSGVPGKSPAAVRPRRMRDAAAERDVHGRAFSSAPAGAFTTIAHTNNPPGADFISEFVVADTSVNSLGKVALAIELRGQPLFDQGLFVGSRTGTFDERFRNSTSEFDTPSSRMSLNEVGQIAFQDNGIVLSNPDGTFRTIVDSNGGDFAVFDPSLNIFGRVAFIGLVLRRRHAGPGHFHEPRRPGDDRRRQHRSLRLFQRAVAERSRQGRLHRRSRRVRAERLPDPGRLHRPGPDRRQGAAGRRSLRRRSGVERLHVRRGAEQPRADRADRAERESRRRSKCAASS